MESITIRVEPLGMTVESGISGRLWYQAPGLDIYVDGAVTTARKAIVHVCACNEALARKIPLLSLRNVTLRSVRAKKHNPDQKRLFS